MEYVEETPGLTAQEQHEELVAHNPARMRMVRRGRQLAAGPAQRD
jgi:hypothetical protein